MFECQIHGEEIPAELLASYRDSTDCRTSTQELQQRLQDDGYVFVRGAIPVEPIMAARHEVFSRLAEVGEIKQPPGDGIFTGRSQRRERQPNLGQFWQSVSEGEALRRVTHGDAMQDFLDTLFGQPARAYDFIFLRPGVPGRFTFLHYDRPFFARGTENVVTTWTAIGGIPTTEGALFVLENSHRFDDLISQSSEIDYDSASSPQVQMMDSAIDFARSRGSRFLTADFRPGDVIVFSMTTMHGTFDNVSPLARTRLSVDVRWQPVDEPMDERYFGSNPGGTTGAGYGELNGAKPLTEPWHTR